VSRSVDVLVVGAGPAGSSLAVRLAGAGADVLLLDERTFPRSKPCGDCVSPGALPLLAELGVLGELDRRGAGRLEGWRIRTPGGAWFGGGFGRAADGTALGGPAIPRRDLDAVLLEAAAGAGARVREGTRAVALLRSGGRIRGVLARDGKGREVRLRAGLVVGADGLRSTVARRIGGVERGERGRLALVARFEEGPEPGDPPVGEMRVSDEGCLGMAPVGRGRWNVTVVVPRTMARAVAAGREAFFRDRLAAYGVAARLAGARRAGALEVTGPFEVVPRRVAVPGALLVGDAAGYFDPFTGQGIHGALAGARIAAACALEALGAPGRRAEAAALLRYESELAAAIGPSRRVQRTVDHVLRRPWLFEPTARILGAAPGLAGLLFRVTGDLEPAGSLLHPARVAAALAGRGPRASRPAGPNGRRPGGRHDRRIAEDLPGPECPDPGEAAGREAACTPTTRPSSGRRSESAWSWRPTSRRGRPSSSTIAG